MSLAELNACVAGVRLANSPEGRPGGAPPPPSREAFLAAIRH